jgi:hypothetical protein
MDGGGELKGAKVYGRKGDRNGTRAKEVWYIWMGVVGLKNEGTEEGNEPNG